MSLIKCPECGNEISDQAKKCIHCGKELFHCPECGKTTVRHGNTCPQCGYELPVAENNSAQQAKSVPQVPVAAVSTVAGSSTADNKNKKSALGAYIDEITSAWRKECRGERIFDLIMLLSALAAYGLVLGFMIEWLVTAGWRWIFDFDLTHNNLVHYVSDWKKTNNVVAIVLSSEAWIFISTVFRNFWSPCRIKAWAKRKGIDLKAELRSRAQNTTDYDKEQMIKDDFDGPTAAMFLATAYDRSPLGYMISEIIRESLEAIGYILFVYAWISIMRKNMNAAILQTSLPFPTRAIALFVLSVAIGIFDPILRRIGKKIVKGYYVASPAPSSPNTSQS